VISWDEHDAKAQFSNLLDEVLKNGPQLIARRGGVMAVLLPIAEWNTFAGITSNGLKTLLLAPAPRVNEIAAARRHLRRRSTKNP
jgi:prevent-host-death family protein